MIPVLRKLAPALERAEAPCPHFGPGGECGGCALQDWTYASQLRAKTETVRSLFARAGVEAGIAEPVPAVEPWFYRNRMDYAVGRWAEKPGGEREIVVGLREAGRFRRVVDLRTCLLLSEAGNALRNAFRDFVRDRALEPFDLKTHRGLVRYLVIREGKNTGRRLATAVATSREFPFDDFARLAREHGCTAAALALNAGAADVSAGEIVAFEGEPLTERVGPHTFRIGPDSFFQPNTRMAGKMVETVGRLLGEARGTLLDVYCGVGLFSISLHERFERVLGIELEGGSVACARENGPAGGASNFEVVAGAAEEVLPSVRGEAAIVDPPRAGLHPRAIGALGAARDLRTIVYVACNPKTLARDVALLAPAFRVDGKVELLDCFPWTTHLEAIARLVRA